MRFGWVGIDAGYGKEPAFLRALDDDTVVFAADVHRTQSVWQEEPELALPTPPPGKGRRPTRRRASHSPVTVEQLARSFRAEDWARPRFREGRLLSCATARAVRCAWMSPAGGSGCGTVRKPIRGAGT